MKNAVYYSKVSGGNEEKRVLALENLLGKARPFSAFKKEEFIPVKITIGDSDCVYNLSPSLVKTVIREIRVSGAKPFLFDTSVIYEGRRQNAVDHLTLVQHKGFELSKVGAPFIVADGVFGQDGKEIEIESRHIKKIKVPSFIGMVDNLVVLSHVTGHIVAGYAAAIKNVAMGMSCRQTKQVQHSSLKPRVIEDKCTACGCCVRICPAAAISFKGKKAFIDESLCLGCCECLCACKFNSIYINWQEDPRLFAKRMADTAAFILSQFKTKFFVNFALDITKECDCISTKDERIVAPDLGILASGDIASLEQATLDLLSESSDFFRKEAVARPMLDYYLKNNPGCAGYELIKV